MKHKPILVGDLYVYHHENASGFSLKDIIVILSEDYVQPSGDVLYNVYIIDRAIRSSFSSSLINNRCEKL